MLEPQSSLNAADDTVNTAAAPPAAITWRAVVIGIGLVPVQCFWIVYSELVAEAADLSSTSLIISVGFVLFLLVGVNLLLRRLAPRYALTQAEMMLIYLLQAVSVGVAGIGMIQFLCPFLANIFYYGTPENGWKSLFLPHIRAWLLPAADAAPDLYQGQSHLLTVAHLRGWAAPVTAWSIYLLLLFWVMFCVNVVIRRPWVERERLSFPIAQLPLAVSDEKSAGDLMRSRALYFGILLTVILEMLAGLNYLYPTIPFVPIKPSDPRLNLTELFAGSSPWSGLGYVALAFYPLVIGITYFLPLDVAFSLWFFYLFTKAENVASIALGYQVVANGVSSGQMPFLGEQSAGAFLGIAAYSIYLMRSHLRHVIRCALRRGANSETGEALPYRTAVWGGLAGFAALLAFGMFAGMSGLVSLMFFVLYLLYLLAFTRIRAEAGLPWGFGPDLTPNQLVAAAIGTHNMPVGDTVGLSMMLWQNLDYRCVEMPNQLEALKIAGVAKMNLRRTAGAIAIATIVGIASSWAAILSCYYQYGAASAHVNGWRTSMGNVPWETLHAWIANPTRPALDRLEAVVVGTAVTALLAWTRIRFVWWPFHPIGYAIAGTQTMPALWCPVLVGWALKLMILRYAGIRGYRRALPFFIGLVVGDYLMCGAWALYGCIAGMRVYRVFPI